MFKRVDDCHRRLGQMARWLCILAGFAMLFVMVFGTGIDVVSRNFGLGIPGIWEAVTLAMRCMIGLALPFTFFHGSHITVEYFTDLFSCRWRQRVMALSALTVLLMVALMAWKIVDRMLAVRGYGGLTSDLGIPVYLEWLALAIGPVLSVPVLFMVLIRALLLPGDYRHSTSGDAS